MKIRLSIDGQVVTATLHDNPTALDFVDLLPLPLTLQTYAVIERISDLPRRVSTVSAPEGMTPDAGRRTPAILRTMLRGAT